MESSETPLPPQDASSLSLRPSSALRRARLASMQTRIPHWLVAVIGVILFLGAAAVLGEWRAQELTKKSWLEGIEGWAQVTQTQQYMREARYSRRLSPYKWFVTLRFQAKDGTVVEGTRNVSERTYHSFVPLLNSSEKVSLRYLESHPKYFVLAAEGAASVRDIGWAKSFFLIGIAAALSFVAWWYFWTAAKEGRGFHSRYRP